jgi:hypothetical protein
MEMSKHSELTELHPRERQVLLSTAYSIVLRHRLFGPASAQEFFATVKKMRKDGAIKTAFSQEELIEIYTGGKDEEFTPPPTESKH